MPLMNRKVTVLKEGYAINSMFIRSSSDSKLCLSSG